MKPSLTHLALHVPDVDACVAFYERYCGMRVTHERAGSRPRERIVWLAEPGREREMVFVLLPGGERHTQASGDYSHLGFALASREEVDAVAARAAAEGCLVWPPRQEPSPVGYYCGLVDPAGNVVEFSFGQPLGPESDADESPGSDVGSAS